MRRHIIVLSIVLSSTAFSQITGARDYSLGGSSVMWLPNSGALYLNPAELARLHQAEVLLSTNRFWNLSSLTSSYFLPFAGTVSAGIENFGSLTGFSMGYGRVLVRQHTIGVAINIFPDLKEVGTLSLGTSLHWPDSSTQNSGFHAAASVVNLSSNVDLPMAGINVGVAYWIRRDFLRLQAAWLQQQRPSFLVGVDLQPARLFSVQLGTRSFKQFAGGVSIPLSYLNVALAFGYGGTSLSINFRISDAAAEQRNANFDLAVKAYDEQRYSDAQNLSLTALQYDEYFSPASRLAQMSAATAESRSSSFFKEGNKLEENGDYLEASKKYAEVIRVNPYYSEAQGRLAEVRAIIKSQLAQLISAGDSLRSRKNYERAKKTYEQALELDPDNQTVNARLDELASLLKETALTSLARARTLMEQNQLDEAQRQYEKILASDPGSAQARAGMQAIRTRRIGESLEKGKTAFDEGRYADALTIFSDVLQRDARNSEARSYLDKVREILQPEVDRYFKSGLQFYLRENYKAALEEWNKALLIQPQHAATLEYYKRAEEKLKALEKLD